MTWDFKVGDKAVCMRGPRAFSDILRFNNATVPIKDAVYTIRRTDILIAQDGEKYPAIWLREITNSPVRMLRNGLAEVGFWAVYFKPLVSNHTKLFRDIAIGVTNGKPIVPDDQPIRVPAPKEGWTVETLTADILRRGAE